MILHWESANGGFKLLRGVPKGFIGMGLKEASQGELTSTVISREMMPFILSWMHRCPRDTSKLMQQEYQ